MQTFKQAYLYRFGRILFNLSIFTSIVSLLAVLMPFLELVYLLFAAIIFIFNFAAFIFSFGQVGINAEIFTTGSELFAQITYYIRLITPYFCGITLAVAVFSIVIFALDKTERHVSKFVWLGIALGIAVVSLILYFVGGLPA